MVGPTRGRERKGGREGGREGGNDRRNERRGEREVRTREAGGRRKRKRRIKQW